MRRQPPKWIGWAFLLTSIVLSAVGQLCMKAGMQELHRVATPEDVVWSISSLAATRPALLWTAAGLVSYGISLLAWLGVLVRFPLSYAYPLLGASYVLVYVGATHWPLLMESATTARTIGTLLIIAGVGLVSQTNDKTRA